MQLAATGTYLEAGGFVDVTVDRLTALFFHGLEPLLHKDFLMEILILSVEVALDLDVVGSWQLVTVGVLLEVGQTTSRLGALQSVH